jgi:beta-lactamase class A
VDTLESDLEALIEASAGEVAVYYQDLEAPDSALINADVRMHAASTMKVPVMIQLFQDREDGPAFQAGLSNTTTARDLGVILSALGRGEVVSAEASHEMLQIMERQRFRTKIPADLPECTRVAHKTGSITGISHDCGIVLPEAAPPFTLVVLTRGFEDPDQAAATAAQISRRVSDYHVAKHSHPG